MTCAFVANRRAGLSAGIGPPGHLVPLRSPERGPRGRWWSMFLRPLVRNRLLHFAVIGAAIFAIAPRPETARDIALDRVSLTALEQAEAQRLGAPALPTEQREAVQERFLED